MQRPGPARRRAGDLHPHQRNAALGRALQMPPDLSLCLPRGAGCRIARVAATRNHELPRRRQGQVGRLFEIGLSLPRRRPFSRHSDTSSPPRLITASTPWKRASCTPLAGRLLCPQRLGDVEGETADIRPRECPRPGRSRSRRRRNPRPPGSAAGSARPRPLAGTGTAHGVPQARRAEAGDPPPTAGTRARRARGCARQTHRAAARYDEPMGTKA